MSASIMEFVSWLGIIGIPSIFTVVIWGIKIVMHYTHQLKTLAKAQQAQMRSQLLEQYHKHLSAGWISEEDMEEWENQYQAYHSLGENGVLDSRRETLMQLPSNPKD